MEIIMKILKKIMAYAIIVSMVFCCMVQFKSITSLAASTNFTISLSSSSIQKGDSVTVTVTLSCSEAIGAYSYCLSYDSSILEYSSGSGYGGGGTISYAGYGDGSSTSASASYTFTAVGTGSASISTNSSEVYTWSEETSSVSNAGASINVGAIEKATETPTEAPAPTEKVTEAPVENATDAPETEQPASEDTTTEENDNTTEEITEATTEEISDNCYLSSLEITPGELEPAFDKETYSYKTTVSGETTGLAINAIPDDSKASVSIEGNSEFEPGKTAQVTITVTAETGDKKTYEIAVECQELIDTRAVINVDGTDMYFLQDYSHVNIPEGFSETTETINENEATLFISPNELIKCAYLTDEAGENGGWYIIDTTTLTAIPMIQKYSAYNYYIILEPGDSVDIPDGYEAFSYKIKKNTNVTAYRKSEDDQIYLVYAMNPETSAGWYLYDSEEKTFVRYIADSSLPVVSDDTVNETFFDKHKNTIIISALVIMFIMIITVIILGCIIASMTNETAKNKDDEPDEIDEDNDYDNAVISSTENDIEGNNITTPQPETDAVENNADADTDNAATPQSEADADIDNAAAPMEETDVAEDNIPAIAPQPESTNTSNNIFAETEASDTINPEEMSELIQDSTPDDNTIVDNVNPEKYENIGKDKFNNPSDDNELIKAAAKYSSMNTADLSEVFNMAADIVKHEGDTSTTSTATVEQEAQSPKPEDSQNQGLKFKPIKSTKYTEDNPDKE
jgi:hypothetical protein